MQAHVGPTLPKVPGADAQSNQPERLRIMAFRHLRRRPMHTRRGTGRPSARITRRWCGATQDASIVPACARCATLPGSNLWSARARQVNSTRRPRVFDPETATPGTAFHTISMTSVWVIQLRRRRAIRPSPSRPSASSALSVGSGTSCAGV